MFELRFSSITDSTNDDAAALLGTPDSGGLVLQADYQRTGRGRRGRAWIAPPKSALLFTAILPEPVPSGTLWCVTFWTALAVADGVEAATGIRLALQWPNDLLLANGKCCGILCVSRVVGTRAWVGCGVGLNVHRPEQIDAGPRIDPPPAFLSDALPTVQRDTVRDAILAAFEGSLRLLDDPTSVVQAWERRALLRGTPYRLRFDADGAIADTIARGIAEDGSLIVAYDGREQRVGLADARVSTRAWPYVRLARTRFSQFSQKCDSLLSVS